MPADVLVGEADISPAVVKSTVALSLARTGRGPRLLMCKAALQAQPVSATQVVFQELLLQLRALANLSGKKDKAKLGEGFLQS